MVKTDNSNTSISIGDLVKVTLPGERPWVIITEIISNEVMRGKIDNRVAGDYTAEEFHHLLNNLMGRDAYFDGEDKRTHAFKCGQELLFVKTSRGWVPKTIH